jgi:hypothetical protein
VPVYCGGRTRDSHCRIIGTRWLPAWPFSAMPLYLWFQLVFAWRHQHYVADGGVICGSLISVILAGVPLTSRKWHRSRLQSVATASYPLFRRVFASRHGYYIQPGDGGHLPHCYIPHSSSCFCNLQEITLLQTTVAHSYSKWVALLVMGTVCWDVNGIRVSTIRNPIRWEGSD